LQYVRFREELKGDIGRVERQQKFLKSMIERMLNPDIIIKLPAIYKEAKNAVDTNIPIQDISPFIHLIKDMELDRFKTIIVPGEPRYINQASYWIADEKELGILVNNLIRSKEYIENNRHQLTIYNGNGEPGLAGRVAEEIEKYGFKIGEVGNADHFNYQETLINYYDVRDKSVAEGISKLTGGKIIHDQENNNTEKGIIIIIGSDYLDYIKD
jgi:polyisoprenyl-teichoic acid--peptidoglycan teichoic acid transferase